MFTWKGSLPIVASGCAVAGLSLLLLNRHKWWFGVPVSSVFWKPSSAAVARGIQKSFPTGSPLYELVCRAFKREDVDVPYRTAALVEQHCKALLDFTGESGDPLALVLCCGCGGIVFQLSKCFGTVLGLDNRKQLIDIALAAKRSYLQSNSQADSISLPDDANLEKTAFAVWTQRTLPAELPNFDAVVIDLSECGYVTKLLFEGLRLLKKGGVLVIVSSCLSLPSSHCKCTGGHKHQNELLLNALTDSQCQLVATDEAISMFSMPGASVELRFARLTAWRHAS